MNLLAIQATTSFIVVVVDGDRRVDMPEIADAISDFENEVNITEM